MIRRGSPTSLPPHLPIVTQILDFNEQVRQPLTALGFRLCDRYEIRKWAISSGQCIWVLLAERETIQGIHLELNDGCCAAH